MDVQQLVPIEQRRATVERIAKSEHLRRSPRLRDFFLYVSARAIENRPEAATETQIGIHVFGRRPSYNPSDDSIVRVSARQLRQKLALYYSTEGAADEVRVEIPKGSYLPVFLYFAGSGETIAPDPAVERPEIARESRDRSWRKPALAALTLCVILALAVLLWRQVSARSPSSLAGALLEQDGPVRIVVADAGMVPLQQLTGTQLSIGQYARKEYYSGLRPSTGGEGAERAVRHLAFTPHAGMGDFYFVLNLFRQNPDWIERVNVLHARDLQVRDAKAGNLWLLGAARVNPWSALFAGQFAFQVEHVPETGDNFVRNLAPRSGEPLRFPTQPGEARGNTNFAHVALLRPDSGTRHVLLIEGGTMEAKEGAGEFVTSPRALAYLRNAMRLRPGDRIPPFEAVLQTTSIDSAPDRWEVVTFRSGRP